MKLSLSTLQALTVFISKLTTKTVLDLGNTPGFAPLTLRD